MSFHVLGTETLASSSNTITINNININSKIKIIMIELILRSDIASVIGNIGIRLNSDSSSNYAYNTRTGNTAKNSGTQVLAVRTDPSSYISLIPIPGVGSLTNTFSTYKAYLFNHNNSSSFSNMMIKGGFDYNASSGYHMDVAGVWKSTSNVTSISFINTDGNFVAGSRVSLFGMGDI